MADQQVADTELADTQVAAEFGGERADQDFLLATDRYRRELMAHCYRMLGSVHDAEDLVQETYLRAWRAYQGFEGRSSLRTWLYRIATNACLNALDSRSRRPLPTGLGSPSSDADDPLVSQPEVPWLEPVPDALIDAGQTDPAAIVVSREGIRLALIAALQHLPPRQRAVLVLREVLRMPAAEVAAVLETSTVAVNSSLQRARAQLEQAHPTAEEVVEPSDPLVRARLDQYVQALQDKDINAIVQLFTADAIWEMPPFTGWYQGRDQIGRLIDVRCPAGPGELRLVPVRANGQPAFAVYLLEEDGDWHAFQLHVLSVGRAGINHVAAFFDVSLYERFGLPLVLPGRPPAQGGA